MSMASRTAYSTWTPQKPTLFNGHYLRNRSTLDRGVLGYTELCISCTLKLSLLCGTEFSRIFFPELYPWRLSFGLATWKWKGKGVDLIIFLCGWSALRGHSWINYIEGDFAYGEGWPAEDVSMSCCIAGVGWAPSTVVSQKVVWLWFGFHIGLGDWL